MPIAPKSFLITLFDKAYMTWALSCFLALVLLKAVKTDIAATTPFASWASSLCSFVDLKYSFPSLSTSFAILYKAS